MQNSQPPNRIPAPGTPTSFRAAKEPEGFATCVFKGCARPKVEAHHPDYRRPLDELWTCRSHHRRLHPGEAVVLKAGVDLAQIPREYAA